MYCQECGNSQLKDRRAKSSSIHKEGLPLPSELVTCVTHCTVDSWENWLVPENSRVLSRGAICLPLSVISTPSPLPWVLGWQHSSYFPLIGSPEPFSQSRVWRGFPAAFLSDILPRARGVDTSVADQQMPLFIPASI